MPSTRSCATGSAAGSFPFDGQAAEAYATIAAGRRAHGKPISAFDAQIAAIARSRGAHVATRNVADFDDCGVEILDP